MANRNHRNNAAAVDVAARLFRRAHDDVSSTLRVVAIVTCVMAARAAVSRPAVSVAYPPAYLAVSLIGGLSTMWAAVWVAGDPARRRADGLIAFYCSLFPMAMAVCLTNDLQFFLEILGAILD